MTQDNPARAGQVSREPTFINLRDYERAARKRSPREVWDFVRGGSCDELTLRENVKALRRYWLKPRVLAGIERCDTSTSLLGTRVGTPIMLAPVAFQKLFDPEGELASARAAAACDALLVVSQMSSTPLSEISQLGCKFWLQLYLLKDRALSLSIVQHAQSLGCGAIVLTIDAPRLGRRERDLRNAFHLPPSVRSALLPNGPLQTEQQGQSALAAHAATAFESCLNWETVAWLRSHTSLPIVLKGVSTRADAQKAADCGIAAIIVSNHGGRQLDGARAAVDALDEIASCTPPSCEIYMDGGIRRGTDALKAGALGARGVLIGRPLVWGLMVGGSAGVSDVLNMLHEELQLALLLSGQARWQELRRDLLEARR